MQTTAKNISNVSECSETGLQGHLGKQQNVNYQHGARAMFVHFGWGTGKLVMEAGPPTTSLFHKQLCYILHVFG